MGIISWKNISKDLNLTANITPRSIQEYINGTEDVLFLYYFVFGMRPMILNLVTEKVSLLG